MSHRQFTRHQPQRVPALRVFWDLEKTVLHETHVSGTVLWSPTSFIELADQREIEKA